jgi:hypothetical protein
MGTFHSHGPTAPEEGLILAIAQNRRSYTLATQERLFSSLLNADRSAPSTSAGLSKLRHAI